MKIKTKQNHALKKCSCLSTSTMEYYHYIWQGTRKAISSTTQTTIHIPTYVCICECSKNWIQIRNVDFSFEGMLYVQCRLSVADPEPIFNTLWFTGRYDVISRMNDRPGEQEGNHNCTTVSRTNGQHWQAWPAIKTLFSNKTKVETKS